MKNLILSNWKYLLLPVLALTGLLAFLFNAIEIGACFYLKTKYKFPFWDLNAFLKHYRSGSRPKTNVKEYWR